MKKISSVLVLILLTLVCVYGAQAYVDPDAGHVIWPKVEVTISYESPSPLWLDRPHEVRVMEVTQEQVEIAISPNEFQLEIQNGRLAGLTFFKGEFMRPRRGEKLEWELSSLGKVMHLSKPPQIGGVQVYYPDRYYVIIWTRDKNDRFVPAGH